MNARTPATKACASSRKLGDRAGGAAEQIKLGLLMVPHTGPSARAVRVNEMLITVMSIVSLSLFIG
jgi:hypothetical protein